MKDQMSINNALADHLQLISHLFAKNKDQWRSRAFSKVAGEVRVFNKKVEIKDGKVIQKIPGVGEAINDVIVEFLTVGTSRKLVKLQKLLPNEVVEKFDAKTAKLKVGKLLKPLTTAKIDWGYAGSMRRGLKTVKDVDVIVCLKNEGEREFIKKVLSDAGLAADVRNGEEKVGVSIPVKSQGRSITLDLNFTNPESRGAHYLYFTGPKAFNIAQRGYAKKKGLLLNQKGLFKGKKMIAGKTEEEIFKSLGQKFVKPEERA